MNATSSPSFIFPLDLVPSWLRTFIASAEDGSNTAATAGKVGQPQRVAWQPPKAFPDAPGPAAVLPELPSRRLKIECLPKEPGPRLSVLVKETCDRHAAMGLKLASTFSHDGSVFLIFKRL